LPPADRRLVERLRMDLLGRTPLGCGRRLLAEELRYIVFQRNRIERRTFWRSD
jgi:hypothetical protein